MVKIDLVSISFIFTKDDELINSPFKNDTNCQKLDANYPISDTKEMFTSEKSEFTRRLPLHLKVIQRLI